ncbi:phage major capsid protein [Sphingomonas sp. SRS2]|uniref:phage major capsid protein n=1 Tax=Sphingomonas sp. SRS2 TaxID=133190 RepID=UPI0006184127|nr:phage major capsid protein [Sphingomonas sp. SRS2]KKC24925.1 hypothetical protein WP12_17050 [Sphingomonas sp. SRS2]
MKTANILALAGATALASAPRAVMARPRAEVPTDPKALFEQLNTAVTAMREKVDATGQKVDALDVEALNKINATVGELQKALNDSNEQIAALKLGGPGDGKMSAKDKEHVAAFNDFTRSGKIEARGATFSDPDGGFLTPKQVDTSISRILGKTVAMRRMSTVMSISGDTYVKHKGLGGASSGWVGEGDARGETNTPQLARLEFATGELYAEPAATQKFLDDSVADVESWYAEEVGIEFAEKEGAAFVSGDGIKKPRGFLSYAPIANANYAWGKVGFVKSGHATAFPAAGAGVNPADCFIDLVHALKAGYRQEASFLMNDLTLAEVRKLKDSEGRWIWQPSLQVDKPELLLGKAVDTDDNMPDLGAGAFPVAFADFKRAYLIVERLGLRVLRNPYKTNGVVFFYTTKRVGGGIQNFEAMKLLKISA